MKQIVRISILERDLGISKDVLRKWESRYGFPRPIRDANGQRCYPAVQVERLRLIKRLIDKGIRPGTAIGLDPVALKEQAEGDGTCIDPYHEVVFDFLRHHDFSGLYAELARVRNEQGISAFVLRTLAPLTEAIGEGWTLGRIAVHQEHLYSEVAQALLRESIAYAFPSIGRPRVVVGTPPGEAHGLGILMLQALLVDRRVHCISLGTEVPMHELASAAGDLDADVVGLSFSLAFPPRRISPLLLDLRRRLPAEVALWAGGRGMNRIGKPPGGTIRVQSLEQALDELEHAGERGAAGGADRMAPPASMKC